MVNAKVFRPLDAGGAGPAGRARALERQRAQKGESPFLAELPARN